MGLRTMSNLEGIIDEAHALTLRLKEYIHNTDFPEGDVGVSTERIVIAAMNCIRAAEALLRNDFEQSRRDLNGVIDAYPGIHGGEVFVRWLESLPIRYAGWLD